MKKMLLSAALLLAAAASLRAQSAPKKAPCDASLSVSGTGEVQQGESVTFYANLQGVPDGVAATYQWSVSMGEIAAGQGTPAITLSAEELKAGQSVTATLEIGALPEGCSFVSGSYTTSITAPAPKTHARRRR